LIFQVNAHEDMALPLGKTRLLPDWMVGNGDRVGLEHPKPAKSKALAVNSANKLTANKELPAKATPKPKRKYDENKF